MDLLSEVNGIGRGVEPGRGVIHPTFYFASWVPGGLENLIGEGYQMTLWETESSTRPNCAVGELKDQLEENCGQPGRCDHETTVIPGKRSMSMNEKLLRRRDVEELTGLSRASIYRLISEGGFPRPVRVSATGVRWRASDIAAWIESRPVSQNELGSIAAPWEPPT